MRPNFTSGLFGVAALPFVLAIMVVLPDLEGPKVCAKSTVKMSLSPSCFT